MMNDLPAPVMHQTYPPGAYPNQVKVLLGAYC